MRKNQEMVAAKHMVLDILDDPYNFQNHATTILNLCCGDDYENYIRENYAHVCS